MDSLVASRDGGCLVKGEGDKRERERERERRERKIREKKIKKKKIFTMCYNDFYI
jgi:hypothetical protein